MAMAVILNGTLVNTLIPAGSGLLGVLIGGWLTALNQKQERREAHFKSQLSEFYSPLLGIRSQIKAKSELRLKLSSVAGAAWPAKFAGIFTDGMWLAEPSTIRHYAALVEFVEIWNRFLDQSLPREVLQQIEHKEETLQPLYADLEHNLSTLSKRRH
jgi:hypothetical protein